MTNIKQEEKSLQVGHVSDRELETKGHEETWKHNKNTICHCIRVDTYPKKTIKSLALHKSHQNFVLQSKFQDREGFFFQETLSWKKESKVNLN